ncbi:DUF2933 domain-containing protein [Alcanivorax limicola]|uniref:DUF2933 domain-containing protein n=1 Tax=Alcanivorax limicola TaxID=2874102 RepID=UPI001CBAA2CA|nr:DUF2933 domain-containing protein [Alcanivorax limicola]
MPRSQYRWHRLHAGCLLLLGAAAFYVLLLDHGEHLRPWLPLLVLLACPLMHLFLHRSHGRQHEHGPASANKNERRPR